MLVHLRHQSLDVHSRQLRSRARHQLQLTTDADVLLAQDPHHPGVSPSEQGGDHQAQLVARVAEEETPLTVASRQVTEAELGQHCPVRCHVCDLLDGRQPILPMGLDVAVDTGPYCGEPPVFDSEVLLRSQQQRNVVLDGATPRCLHRVPLLLPRCRRPHNQAELQCRQLEVLSHHRRRITDGVLDDMTPRLHLKNVVGQGLQHRRLLDRLVGHQEL